MSKIIVVGSLNMDLVISAPHMPQNGETLMGYGFMTNPGGKGANQAIGAARLNGNVYMVGCVGNDMFGDQLKENLVRNGVNSDNLKTDTCESTGVAVIVIADEDNRIILDSGTNFKVTPEQVEEALNSIGEAGDILLVQLEIPVECVERALKKGREKGMINILNPAPAVKLNDSVYKLIDFITPNESECEILSGIKPVDQQSLIDSTQYFINKGVRNVIITLGKNGVSYTKDGIVEMKSVPDVQVVDTTAAGDSFSGALALCLSNNMSIDDTIDFCNIIGTLTVMKKGAQISLPYYDEVMNYIKTGELN